MASLHSSWRFGKRSKLRIKVSQDPEDYYRLDPKKLAAENAYDIYKMLCCRETRDNKRLFLLNELASLCLAATTGAPLNQLRFTTEELLYCLSASMVHTFTQVRAAALRTIRYALTTPKDIKVFNSLQLQHLLCRSIDLMLKNDDERVQALKLVRKMLAIAPEDISPVVVRCLVSLADSGIEESDNLLRACLATLAEFAVLNPALLIVCGGVTSITRNVLECHNPRIAESLCGVLLYLLEWPHTRNICGVRLDCLAAPYCDFTYRLGIMDKNKDARELRYTSCRLALLSVLRSWTGTLEFCDPSKPSGLKAIVDALYLNQIEVRKAILDLLYQLLSLPQPAWTDDYALALQAVDPSDFQDSWLLTNGFVAAEGRSILPSLAARAPNVVEQHLALLLYCFLETGLLNALVEVAVSSDQFVSVRATVLIGKILQLMHTHLPADICSTSPALPTLIGHATKGNQQANAAVAALQNYQKMLRQRPASCSMFLDSIIQGGALIHTRLFRRNINAQEQGNALSLQELAAAASAPMSSGMNVTMERQRLDSVSSNDEPSPQTSNPLRASFRLRHKLMPNVFFDTYRSFNRLLTESNVLVQTDANAWDWEVVSTILRSILLRKVDYTVSKFLNKFLKRLVDYFKPSNNRFSHQDLMAGHTVPAYVTAGLNLIDVLVNSNELECMRFITDYFSDIGQHLQAVTTSNRAHDCLFSPQHMNNTMCQQYFLFIGRMCRTQKGINILENTTVFKYLKTLVRHTDHVCYVKLIVSGLNYSYEKEPREVLKMALTSAKTRSGRLYATQFLSVLLRARLPNFEVWGIPLIIEQAQDADRSVVLAAMDVLEEACHEKYYLEEIISLWPNLKHLGDVGRLVMSRYYSLPRGMNNSKARVKEEIEYWRNGYNKRYVLLVEADTHASLTLHVRNEDGYYSRRNCNTRPTVVPPNIAPHLYGQMVQTAQGTTALRKHGDLPQLVELVSRGKCTDEAECLELKAAIWAVSHASTHANGIEYFVEIGAHLYEKLVLLVTKCEVYSVRATCFSALGLIAGTQSGANILFKLNWLSVRHDRNTMWPVHQPEDWMSSNYTPVRHHYEDMPPYNYTGIEDQIDGSYYTGSYWNLHSTGHGKGAVAFGPATSASSELQDANTTTESLRGIDELPTSKTLACSATAARSKTLPEGTHLRPGKHQRSLSESKTTDVISLIGGNVNAYPVFFPFQHRIRVNSCTDSNTSGVSSCESVTGRTAAANMGDFPQFPLSPIPSISNLLVLPTLKDKLLRRTSLLGTSYLQHALSPLGMKGYAQLRLLRAHSRPVFNESAAILYDIIDIKDREMRPRKSSWGESQRRTKVRSLDRQAFLNVFTLSEQPQVPLPTLNAPKFLSQNDLKGPCYAGICLPKNALDLFPTRNLTRTYVSRDIQDQDLVGINLLTAKQQFLNDSLNNEGGDESSVISSLSDVSSVSKRQTKWHQNAKHGRNQCLHCTRARRQLRVHALRQDGQEGGTGTNGGAGTGLCELASLFASGIRRQGSQQQQHTTNSGKHHQMGNATTESNSTIQLSDISFNSPESILSEESLPDRLTASILYNVQRLANPVSAKQSKMSLLELKQKHPNAFQDICLYSESCKALGRSSYRMSARRFLQELFLDLNFDAFYTEPQEIIAKKSKHGSELDTQDLRGYNPMAVPPVVGPGSSYPILLPLPPTQPLGLPHKTQLKSKPLASVYETSWENLLMEQSPRLSKMQIPRNLQKYLHATSSKYNTADDDESDANNNDESDTGEDVCDGSGSGAGTQTPNVIIATVVPVTEQSVSDQTTNSNRSSVCTISLQPSGHSGEAVAATATTPKISAMHNENTQFARGRFYTLELDLSCTKNKFPITDRTRRLTTGEERVRAGHGKGPFPDIIDLMEETISRDLSAPTSAQLCHSNESSLQFSNVTKSLAASMAKPVGSLYCEKRLQSSKSEAVLACGNAPHVKWKANTTAPTSKPAAS
ncbi:rapamycin-insensitive companion of mTOR [Scaptodrosophila lebanonensis]|uniref:Rapamycin-insensitive companion of mTOR n=1 Tax=Drosophila lebanonensis TaxID=7225 RepID=A0A6J2U4G8_DROLE|nr:rapamycin-insensitive companion of mTOR [Scaptodrosophila lebanonensis]XP_030382025.1 rapamycin-insensitive companion of mTOR [Scaptodrosophila lebanonensis]XP_030382026.1 rapamycin-insensitive companion of mTOR [Scaptodrosophila lebanonensis]XP_030382027.1 rapamycin-insensitive companion of mTOR [Scaptodrosophila lebanonensis]